MLGEVAPPLNRFQEINAQLIGEIEANSALGDTQPHGDILGTNDAFTALPGLIRDKDFRHLGQIADSAARMVDVAGLETAQDLKDAQRDLSMLVTAATLTSPYTFVDEQGNTIHDADRAVPYAAGQLLRLSDVLDYPARTTDLNWANKDNPRFFTDNMIDLGGRSVRAESIIKVCVGKNWDMQDETISTLVQLTEGLDVDDPRFVQLVRQSVDDFSHLVSAVAILRTKLTDRPGGRAYFMKEFMPLTMKYKIGGRILNHSGSQFLPLHLADEVFGITDSDSPDHNAYHGQSYSDALPHQKDEYSAAVFNVQRDGNVVERVLASPNARESASAVGDLLDVLAQFRNAHTTAIEKSEPERPNGESSGGQLPKAYELRDRTLAQRERVRQYLAA